jgi:hypothetical protein
VVNHFDGSLVTGQLLNNLLEVDIPLYVKLAGLVVEVVHLKYVESQEIGLPISL